MTENLYSKVDQLEEKFSHKEDKNQERTKKKINEKKQRCICEIWVSQRFLKDKEKGIENLKNEIIVKSIPGLETNMSIMK